MRSESRSAIQALQLVERLQTAADDDYSPGVDDEEAEAGTVKLLGRSAEAFHSRVVGHFGESTWLV